MNQSLPKKLNFVEPQLADVPDQQAILRATKLLRENTQCEILDSPFDLGRYSTDASHYQIFPALVALPRSQSDLPIILEIASETGIVVTGRGGGTSQNGQTINRGIVIDYSKYLNKLIDLNSAERTCTVEPGLVLDHLNAKLQQYKLWYPVDVSTSSRATLGGMAGNNSCGSRSIRYGTMRDNVHSIDLTLAKGDRIHWQPLSPQEQKLSVNELKVRTDLLGRLLYLGANNREIIEKSLPQLMRRVGGYNIDALIPAGQGGSGCWPGTTANPSHLFVGSEGTLGLFHKIHLKLTSQPINKTLGVCHFKTFYEAMDATQHIVRLNPSAVELVDRTMIDLSRKIPMFAKTVNNFVVGEPDALLLVEFDDPNQTNNIMSLNLLEDLLADMGNPNAVVKAKDPSFQKQIWEVRKQGLNIMMSMKNDAKPISIVEDCAVDLPDLAEYTRRLTQVFEKHGTTGTWYAHASVGTLHVRPILNLKQNLGVEALRSVAEEAFALVREYKGSHSGEHGDGIARSEFHEYMFGRDMVRLFEKIKTLIDPNGIMNPNKIVWPPKHDNRELFRYPPDYEDQVKVHGDFNTGFDWSAWGGFSKAVEMCNNNGACRKTNPGVMCPSYRVTKDEKDLVRGRANTLRLALSGRLGLDAITTDEMLETMKLCVGCKACQNECPTSVDMAKMKTEVLHQRAKKFGLPIRDYLVAFMPRYAPFVSRIPWLANSRNKVPGLAKLTEILFGFSANRNLPNWAGQYISPPLISGSDRPPVVLLGDTFNRSFEPHNLYAARAILEHLGFEVIEPKPQGENRPVCCGRTFLAAGLINEAKAEALRLVETVKPWIVQGIPVIGLEPSCLLTLRDEFLTLLPGSSSTELAENCYLFEEFLQQILDTDEHTLSLKPASGPVYLHGHCHQKAARVMPAVESVLRHIPDVDLHIIDSSCCGMAGHFGYQKETYDISVAMAEISLLPAIRELPANATLVANGTSCRHQVQDLGDRQANHVAHLLFDLLIED